MKIKSGTKHQAPVHRTKSPARERVAKEVPNLISDGMERLSEIFPQSFSEGKVDFEKLRATLGELVDNRPERFTFSWAGKRNAVQIIQMPTRATLIPVQDKSVNFDTSENLFIEGDSLEVLKLLYKPYFGKVKMIYIDPPFNTGKNFIYSDNYADPLDSYLKFTAQKDPSGNLLTSNPETSGRYHSSWLSMLYPRLFLARQLLSEDGIVFVSIDDHEVHNLRLLMNEIFGEESFIVQFVWNTEGHTDNQFQVKVNHEYVLSYARTKSATLGYVVDPNTREESNLWKGFAENSITKNGPGNPPSEVTLPVGFPCAVEKLDLESSNSDPRFFDEVAAQGYITREITKKFDVTYPVRKDRMICRSGKLEKECKVFSGWANVNKLKAFIASGCKPVSDDNGDTLEFYLSDKGVIYYRKKREKARNILSVLRNMGTTEQMRSELEELGINFQYPKPKDLIKYLIKMGLGQDGFVLDFFAGSCTTAQAVLELNREDRGGRRFIMVQLQEPTADDSSARRAGYQTVSEIGEERIRRVIKKLSAEQQERLDKEGTEDLGFRIFRLTASNYKPWKGVEEKTPENYAVEMEAHLDPLIQGWKRENVIYEVAIKEGYGLTVKIEPMRNYGDNEVWRVTDENKNQAFLICLDKTIKPSTIKSLDIAKDDIFVCRDTAIDDTGAANLALQCMLKTI